MKTVICFLISDFNLSNLSALLANSMEFKFVTEESAYNQAQQLLMSGPSDAQSAPADIALVWTQPKAVLPSFSKALGYEEFALEDVLNEVDAFCGLLKKRAVKAQYYLIPTWVAESYRNGYGLMGSQGPGGLADIVNAVNCRLVNNLRNERDFFILDANRWIVACGKKSFSPKLWYMAKMPFEAQVYKEAVSEIVRLCHAVKGTPRKLVIVDLDDVLWGGILGDAGLEGINLGGHDPLGEAFADFQRELKALTRRGIVLAIASKNDEQRALETIENHPEMILCKGDFAAWRINWDDKAKNIAELAAELNLGLKAAVFIDDNPLERARIRDVFPEVYVPEWPKEKMLYASTLLGMSCFDSVHISEEDLQRSKMYATERNRREARKVTSYLDWLKGLETRIGVEPLNDKNIQRITQLLNKTNQMNLRTRRMSESEIWQWSRSDGHFMWGIRICDKFGDSGLTGIISLEVASGTATVADYVLSCRVMGRQIEEAMFFLLCDFSKKLGARKILFKYEQTARNKPCLDFLNTIKFQNKNAGAFVWDLNREVQAVSHIELQYQNVFPALDKVGKEPVKI